VGGVAVQDWLMDLFYDSLGTTGVAVATFTS